MNKLPDSSIIADKINSLQQAFGRGEYCFVVAGATALCEQEPAVGRPWHLRGAALLALNEAQEARSCLDKAAKLIPGSADVWDHLGAALTLCGEYAAAEDCFSKSLKIQPRRLSAFLNGAKNAKDWGDYSQVLAYADRLIAGGAAGRTAGLRHRIDALRRLGRGAEAVEACIQLRLQQPEEIDLLLTLARLLTDLKRHAEVIKVCEDLLQLAAENLTGISLLARSLQSVGRLSEAVAILEAALSLAMEANETGVFSSLAFNYMYLPERTVEQNLSHAKCFGASARLLAAPYANWYNERDPDRHLKIGLVTGDLRRHPVGYFLADVLTALQGSSLRISVYDTLNRPDEMTEKIRPTVHVWHNAAILDDAALAALIRADAMDIVIDLAGHSATNRQAMLARKPAPVQVSWAGYLATTGNPGIDYVLADQYCVPESGETEFSEKVWRLPESTYCFSLPEFEVPVLPPPLLSNGYVTFGSCNNPDKFNDAVLKLWGRILAAVPGSRLLLKGKQWNCPEYEALMRERMAAAGLDPARVDTEGPSPRNELLNAYSRIDITLDPFPYSGGTTTIEALWAGVPVLAMKGDRMVWRMAESFLRAAGLMDWLAEDPDGYVALAAAKGGDIDGLVRLRALQRRQVESSILFNPQRFSMQLEEALRGMWRDWCK